MRTLALISLSVLVTTACAAPDGTGLDPFEGKPDLRIKSSSIGVKRIAMGHQLPMMIEVKNKNKATGTVKKTFHLSVVARVPGSEGNEALSENVRFDAPTLGNSTPVTFVKIDKNLPPKTLLPVQTAGYVSLFPSGSTVELVVTVDSKNRIDELDETNNTNYTFDMTGTIEEESRILVTLP